MGHGSGCGARMAWNRLPRSPQRNTGLHDRDCSMSMLGPFWEIFEQCVARGAEKASSSLFSPFRAHMQEDIPEILLEKQAVFQCNPPLWESTVLMKS